MLHSYEQNSLFNSTYLEPAAFRHQIGNHPSTILLSYKEHQLQGLSV